MNDQQTLMLQGPKQQALILRTADLIEQRYVFPQKGKEIADALKASRAEWHMPLDGKAFATKVTQVLRDLSGDGHLGLSYSETPISDREGDEAFSELEMEKWYGAHVNHGIQKVERLEHNIMLLDLRVFPPVSMAGEVIAAVMTVVAQGDALILDLRHNAGGSDTSNLLMGYLLAGGSPLSGTYDRPSDTHSHATSPAWVPGRRFGETKPLYILTSKRTFSAGEAVAYDLQALGRAVIVGETTGGGAHPFEYRPIDPHFAVDLPEARSINPITGSNWQDVGVKPNIEVPAIEALEKAIELAKEKLSHADSSDQPTN